MPHCSHVQLVLLGFVLQLGRWQSVCNLKQSVVPRQIVDVSESQQVLASYPATALRLPYSSTDMMYLIYTSGSTGNPKGVMLNHMGFINLLDWSVREYGLSSQSSILLKTAVSFDPSVFEIFAPLALGGRLVIAKPGGHEDPGYVRDLITAERYVTGIPKEVLMLGMCILTL